MPVTKIQPSGVNTQASFSFANVAVTANLTTSGTLEATGNVALSGANVSLGNVANLKMSGANANTVLAVDSSGNMAAQLITQDNIAPATLEVISGVKVSAIGYPGNDTAADIAGGQTITLTGVGFKAGATVLLNGVYAGVVTVVNSTTITFTAPAQSAGTYPLYVINTDGATAIAVPGISYSGVPNWSTSAGSLGNVYETTAINNTVTATGDAPVTYSLQSGALPAGASLNSANGLISGTSVATGSPTTYTFTIRASDAQNQDTDRQFSLTINPDVVTWSSPANNATLNANVNTTLSNVTMSATSAAGYNITYTADTLPTGLSISGANITGTPTVVANTTTTLTATSATTNRTATRTVNWVISVANDVYFNYTTTLLNAEISTPNAWIDDASTNKFAVTVNGDTRPVAFSPYNNDFSVKFDGSNDYISVPAGSDFSFGTGDFTIECFINTTDNSLGPGGYSRSIMRIGDFDFYLRITQYHGGTDGALVVAGLSDGSTVSLKDGLWHHIALVRQSNTIRLWIDGIYQTSGSGSSYTTNHTNADLNTIGCRSNPIAGNFNGYITNVRVVKGTAVYTGTSNFTVSTSPLTAVANTVLLACARNRFIDANATPKTITVNDAPVISGWTPLIETDITTGSGYFDGTGDNVQIPYTASLSPGTAAYCFEVWVYFVGSGDNQGIIGTTSDGFAGFERSGGNWAYYYGTGGIGTGIAAPINQWHHVVICRNGSGAGAFFVNGTRLATFTDTANKVSFGNLQIGYNGVAGGAYTNGYISNYRYVNGATPYDPTLSSLTVSTSPLTAIANTSVLTLQYRTGENNNRFVDTSGINNIITRNGNTTQGTFTPYSLTGWSNYFDGTGDFFNITYNAAFDITQGEFTVEAWVYRNAVGATHNIFSNRSDSPSAGWEFRINSTNTLQIFYTGGSSVTSTGTVPANTWTHIAASRSGTTVRLFINGTLDGSATFSNGTTSTNVFKIGADNTDASIMNGYISNARVVKGTAVYTSAFTPSTSPLPAITNTSLLTCQSNRFIDNSGNNFTLTRNGDVSVQSFSPFGARLVTPTSYSGYFDGTGDYLSIPDSQTFMNIGTNNLTIEGWVYFNSVGTGTFFGTGDSGGNSSGGVIIYLPSSGTLKVFGPSVSGTITASVVTGTWYHIAVTRQTNTWTLWLNGTSQGTFSDSGSLNPGSSRPLAIGRLGAYDGLYLTGYVSNVRFINGTALYTTNFTPSTTPLTAIANTSLLTCQNSTFIDNSTNNFTITVNGDAAPRSFNPFGNTVTSDVEYSVATVGGSMFFDGTGDSLSNVANSNLALGSGNFTVEMWLYPLTLTTYTSVWGCTTSAAVATGFHCGFNANGEMFIYQNSGFRLGPSATSGVVRRNAWNHLAIVRNSGVIRFYVNGIAASTTWSTSQDFSQGTNRIGVAPDGSTEYYNGYITDLRILKGTVLYTSNFVPPVAPITPIAGTTLLLNGTNGGIIDYAGKNNLETVGNSRTSTAVVKYGSRSLYFDGTGDYLVSPQSTLMDLQGNFTIELWVYFNSVASASFVGKWAGDGSRAWLFQYVAGTGLRFYTGISGGIGTAIAGAWTPSDGVWYHVAVSRSSGSVRLFVNGSQVGATTSNTDNCVASNQVLNIGRNADGDVQHLNGYIDDLRITKGFARYTSNFTPPSSALMAK